MMTITQSLWYIMPLALFLSQFLLSVVPVSLNTYCEKFIVYGNFTCLKCFLLPKVI